MGFGCDGGGFGIEFLLIGHGAMGVRNGLGDVTKDAGFLGRKAMFDHGVEDSAHGAIDIGGSGKVAGGGKKFRRERGVERRGFRRFGSAGRWERRGVLEVGGAELWMLWGGGIAAARSIGKTVDAARLVGARRLGSGVGSGG